MNDQNSSQLPKTAPVVKEVGIEEPNRSAFRFTILDLLWITSFVAIIFSLPGKGVAALVGTASVLVIIAPCLLFFAMFTARRRSSRNAKIERLLIRVLFRVFVYSFSVFVVGGIAISSQALK